MVSRIYCIWFIFFPFNKDFSATPLSLLPHVYSTFHSHVSSPFLALDKYFRNRSILSLFWTKILFFFFFFSSPDYIILKEKEEADSCGCLWCWYTEHVQVLGSVHCFVENEISTVGFTQNYAGQACSFSEHRRSVWLIQLKTEIHLCLEGCKIFLTRLLFPVTILISFFPPTFFLTTHNVLY